MATDLDRAENRRADNFLQSRQDLPGGDRALGSLVFGLDAHSHGNGVATTDILDTNPERANRMNAELLAIGQSLARKFPPRQLDLPAPLKAQKKIARGNKRRYVGTKRMIKFAAIFKISPKTFRQWRKDGQVPYAQVNRLLDEIAK